MLLWKINPSATGNPAGDPSRMRDVVQPLAPGASVSARGAVSRRSLMVVGALGLAGLTAAGCSVDNPVDDDAPARPAALAPDVAVATRALREITAVRTAVEETLRRYPVARARLAPMVELHRAHEKTLVDAVPDRAESSPSPTPYAVPRRRAAALRVLTPREQQLHVALDGLALQAESGEFARLLASMGAGIAQQVAVWDA